jgi:hypothetical protein
MYLLVDGHSVLHAPEWRAIHQRAPASARDRLAGVLQHLQDASTWRITLVFDGKAGIRHPRRPSDIVIAYSQKGESADSVIERLVGQSGKASEIMVVTADQAERTTVESLGAQSASPEWLAREIALHGEWLDERIERIHRGNRW